MILFDNLTARQNQVANMILECKSNKEISQELNIEVRTVKYHVGSIYQKFGMQWDRTTGRVKLTMELARMCGRLATRN